MPTAAKPGRIVTVLAGCWVAAHLLPVILAVPPATAVEVVDDDAISLVYDQGGNQLQCAAALAVTVLSILPTPGMFGMNGGDDVYREAEKKNRFGFKNLEDVLKAARGASEDGGDRGSGSRGGKRSGGGPKMAATNGNTPPQDWRCGGA